MVEKLTQINIKKRNEVKVQEMVKLKHNTHLLNCVISSFTIHKYLGYQDLPNKFNQDLPDKFHHKAIHYIHYHRTHAK